MSALAALLAWLVPLTVLAMLSPVVFVNASTVAASGDASYRWRFVAGNAAVLVLLGTLTMGLFGATASVLTVRELSSRWFEGVLGVLLAVLAVSLLRSLLHDRRRNGDVAGTGSTTVRPEAVVPVTLPRSAAGWGALGMAANLPTTALYVAMAQRVGVAELPWPLRVAVMAVVTVLVLLPAWLPTMLTALAPGRAVLSPRLMRRAAGTMRAVAVVASAAGAVYLLGHALLG